MPTNFLRPYQGYGDIYLYEFASIANYNSLQVSLRQRTRRSLRASLSYTFSKTLGGAATDGTWKLPMPGRRFGHRKIGLLTDGWEISGITRMMVGAPFTPGFSAVDGQDITGTPSEGARINVVEPTADPKLRWGRPRARRLRQRRRGLAARTRRQQLGPLAVPQPAYP